jgi:citrate lyase beta subunit
MANDLLPQAALPAVDLARAFLFTPGNRPERFAKGLASGVDALILDLEDAVAPQAKAEARAAVLHHFSARQPGPGPLCGLRVNSIRTAAGVSDLDALLASAAVPDFLVLPKVESAFEVQLYTALLRGPQERIALVCGIESVAGLENALAIAAAHPRVRSLAFGGADLAAEQRSSLSWEALYLARARLVQAAAAAAIGVVDVPQIALDDEAGLQRHCERIRDLGFTGKLAIHPRQVKVIQEAFTPSEEEIRRSSAIVEAFRQAHGNVVEFEGRMVEGPIVKAAERILARAGRAPG